MAKDRCSAHRRDGKPCGAPAIEYGTVCLRHGGSAPQVRFAAERLRREFVLADAVDAWREAGEPVDYDLLGKINRARYDLADFERKLDRLRELRSTLAAARKAQAARVSA